jgi:hypothetical protein
MSDNKQYTIREIGEQWNDQMLDIIDRSPIEASGLKLVLDRRPDVFALPKIVSEQINCAGIFQGDKLIGFSMMLHEFLHLKGKVCRVLYFGNLVVDSSARGKGFLFRLPEYYRKDFMENEDIGYAIIMEGNVSALNLLDRYHPKFPDIPYTKIFGKYFVENIILAMPVCMKSPYQVRRAVMDDLDILNDMFMQEYRNRLFGPYYTSEKIRNRIDTLPGFSISNYYLAEKQGRILGVCCAWDCESLKRNRVVSFSKGFKRTVFLMNLLSRIMNFSTMPKKGESFKSVTITDYSVPGKEPGVLMALLKEVYREYRKKKYHTLLLGHPSFAYVKKALQPFLTRSVSSNIILFSKNKDQLKAFTDDAPPFVDMLHL